MGELMRAKWAGVPAEQVRAHYAARQKAEDDARAPKDPKKRRQWEKDLALKREVGGTHARKPWKARPGTVPNVVDMRRDVEEHGAPEEWAGVPTTEKKTNVVDALLESSFPSNNSPERDAARQEARERWNLVRHSNAMRHAVADTSWTAVAEALRRNDERLSEERLELQRAREQLDELDVKIRQQLTHERLIVMHGIATCRQEFARAGQPPPTAKELHAAQPQATLAAVKKATTVLAAMKAAGMQVSEAALLALLAERAAVEVM